MLKQVSDIALFVLLTVTHVARAQVTGTVELVSKAAEPSSTARASLASMSGDGRYAVFVTKAPNVLPGQVDHNNGEDVFLYDRIADATILVSHVPGEPLRAGNGASYLPAISANGESVAFVSVASDLVAGVDSSDSGDVFLFNSDSGVVSLVSHAAGAPATAAGGVAHYRAAPAISADGAFVAFTSSADDLVAGQVDSTADDVFLFDRSSGNSVLVSHTPENPAASAALPSINPVISANGAFVAFESDAWNLVAGQVATLYYSALFLYERGTGVVALVSHAAGEPTTEASGGPAGYSISGDGAVVAFASGAFDIVPDRRDRNGGPDVFLYDRVSGENTLVSHRPGKTAPVFGQGSSHHPAISEDGNFVAFVSDDDRLTSGQDEIAITDDVYFYDRRSDVVSLLSHRFGEPTTAVGAASEFPAISADGQVVAFQSAAGDIVPGEADVNGADDVFVYDHASATVTIGSHAWSNATDAANAASFSPLLSADGSALGFSSMATDLVPGQGNDGAAQDAFLLERASGSLVRASRIDGPFSATANGTSGAFARTSSDGRFVVFLSSATNVVPGQVDTNGIDDVFLRDRTTGETVVVSHSSGSTVAAAGDGGDWTGQPEVSADGAFVVFVSSAKDLVDGQYSEYRSRNVFLWERATGHVTLVSHAAGAAAKAANNESVSPALSANGAFVAFVSGATNLVDGPFNVPYGMNVFLFERSSGFVSLVSRAATSDVVRTDGASPRVAISADGSRVAFASATTNLVEGQVDTNQSHDAFLFDRLTAEVRLVSHVPESEAATGNRGAGSVSISADGSVVAFGSLATNLVAGQSDHNSGCTVPGACYGSDVFLYDCATRTLTLASHAASGSAVAGNKYSWPRALSSDGRFVAFESGATDFVAEQTDTNDGDDVFVYDHESGSVSLASHVPGLPTTAGNGRSHSPAFSGDAGSLAFSSEATDLVAGQVDDGGGPDVFLFRRKSGAVSMVSHLPDAPTSTGDAGSSWPSISADGRVVVFSSDADDLVTDDYNAALDVFAYLVSKPGISITPTAGLTTNESGSTAELSVVLDSQPTADVAVGISSGDPTEATVSPASLTFTPANWSAPQVVTVRGVDDPDFDGPTAFSIVTAPAVSADPEYSGLDPADVAGTNLDNESGPDPQRRSRPHRHLTRHP